MNLWLLSYWGLNRRLLGRGRRRGCGGRRLGLLSGRCGGLLGHGGLLSQQLLLVQARGQLRRLLLVEVLCQRRLGAALRHHRELGEGRLLGGWVCCLKLGTRSGKKEEGKKACLGTDFHKRPRSQE